MSRDEIAQRLFAVEFPNTHWSVASDKGRKPYYRLADEVLRILVEAAPTPRKDETP